MKRGFPRSSSFVRAFPSARLLAERAALPLLLGFLFVGTCAGEGGDRSGFVLAFKAGRVTITAAWCETPSAKRGT
jgi:hypothetical protein